MSASKSVKNFIRTNPDVIFTNADKGNVTVALDRIDYVEKMTILLSDRNTYVIVNKDPTRKLIAHLHDRLMGWKKGEIISDHTYRMLNCTDGVLPRAYGLPKIHKPGCPLRVIVSSVNTPLFGLATFLHEIIYSSIPAAKSQIINSFQLVRELKGRYVGDEFKLISIDVVSLFTNVPLDLTMDSITRRWHYIESKCTIPRDDFLWAVHFVLSSTYFLFNDICYQQTYGTPIGSPLSPVIADITLQDIEERAIETLSISLPFYYRYVDDIVLAVPSSFFNEVLHIFNAFHPRLQFMMEEGIDNRLNFLDVTLILKNNFINFDWYHKPTFSARYLHFESRHPLCHKRGTAIGLIDRAFLLSEPGYHQKNFELVINILLTNGYPLSFIFDTLHKRLKQLFHANNSLNNVPTKKVYVTNRKWVITVGFSTFHLSRESLTGSHRCRGIWGPLYPIRV